MSGVAASARTYEAGLFTLCSTDSFIRIGGVNDSPLAVTITATELDKGKTVELLGPNSSDELRGIFPIVIPAGSNAAVTWDLPVPAHLDGQLRTGNDRSVHGSWLPKQWTDENGLSYKGTHGTGGPTGKACEAAPTTPSTTSTTTATMTAPPSEPVLLRPAALYSTSNSQLAALAGDGNPSTAFVTQMGPSAHPTWAWLNADLGENVPLARVDWMWSAPGAADQVRIEVSLDGIGWTTIARPGEAPVGNWSTVSLDLQVRIVRFRFDNPKRDPQLGHLAEVRFFARPGFVPTSMPQVLIAAEITSRAEVAPQPESGIVLSKDRKRFVVKNSMRSSNSPVNSARLTVDGNASTAWQTAMNVTPVSGWTAYDLGGTAAIGEIRWKFSKTGFADKFVIQSSPDGIHWTTFASASNAKANKWVKLKTATRTRYVRFLFSNPNKDANLGYLSEVVFYAAKK